jgi:hypothetical protein
MSAVQCHCPLCEGLFQVDDALSGVEVNCPHCQGLVTVPNFSGPPASPSSAIALSCPICAGPFQVTVEMVGQAVHCPHCNEVVAVPDLAGGVSPGYVEAPPSDAHGAPPPEPLLPPQRISTGAAPAGDLYPPGYPPGYQPAKQKTEQQQPRERVGPRLADAGDLLPPGVGSAGDADAERRPLPASIPTQPKDVVLIPTEKSYVGGVQAPVKTVKHHGEEVALRRLTPKEKARRRVVRNTILFLFCVITLVVVMALFMWKQE